MSDEKPDKPGTPFRRETFVAVADEVAHLARTLPTLHSELWPLGYSPPSHGESGRRSPNRSSLTESTYGQGEAIRGQLIEAKEGLLAAVRGIRKCRDALNRGYRTIDRQIPQVIEPPDDRLRERMTFYGEQAEVHENHAKHFRNLESAERRRVDARMVAEARKKAPKGTPDPLRTMTTEEAARELRWSVAKTYEAVRAWTEREYRNDHKAVDEKEPHDDATELESVMVAVPNTTTKRRRVTQRAVRKAKEQAEASSDA